MNKLKVVLFSVIVFIVFFGAGELILRVTNFKYANTPLEMWTYSKEKIETCVNGNNQKGIIRFRKDPVQFWAPVKSFENELTPEKSKDVIRIAALGDSCTQGCSDWDLTYPKLLEKLLQGQLGTKKVEVLNSGVGSYSSFQGLKRLEHVVFKFHPDLLLVYFGWNDHWISRVEDKDIPILSSFQVFALNLMEQFRFFQFMNFLITRVRGKTLEQNSKYDIVFRVPVPEYEKNLNRFVDLAQAKRIPIVLITAPHGAFQNFIPFGLFPFSKEDLIAAHYAYNQVVRKVAYERGVFLLDMDEEITRKSDTDDFFSDNIHFNSKGCDKIAKMVADLILKNKILS